MHKRYSQEQLKNYYSALPRENRYTSQCVMHLPSNLEGKKVLDLECRRGKGVFAISDQIGQAGFVIGMDSSASHIEQAIVDAPKNYRRDKKWSDHLLFVQGFFEDLDNPGFDEGSIDVVIVNSVLNLAYDLKQALQEIHRILSPDGYLYQATIFAKTALPLDTATKLRLEGNVFGASLTADTYEAFLRDAGFSDCQFLSTKSVLPSGLDDVEALQGINFVETVVKAQK